MGIHFPMAMPPRLDHNFTMFFQPKLFRIAETPHPLFYLTWENTVSRENIPILPEAFLTFASKSSVGPSYVANGQEDHETYTNLNDDTVIMTNYCYCISWKMSSCAYIQNQHRHMRLFFSRRLFLNSLCNVQVYCAMSKVKVEPYEIMWKSNICQVTID